MNPYLEKEEASLKVWFAANWKAFSIGAAVTAVVALIIHLV